MVKNEKIVKTKTKLKRENRKRLKIETKNPKLKRKTKNLPTKTRQFRYNTPEMRLGHAVARHCNHEACCTTVFSQIVKRLAS